MNERVEHKGKSLGKWAVAAIIAIVALLIIAGIFFVRESGIYQVVFSVDALQDYLSNYGDTAILVYFIIQILSVILAPIPNNIAAAAGGLVFGWLQSFLVSLAAVMIGSVFVFALARRYGKPLIDRMVDRKQASKYIRLIETKGDYIIAATFFLPFFPDDLICLLAGLTNIRYDRFILILVLTRPWGMLTASAFGNLIPSIPWWGWLILVIATGLIALIIKRYRAAIEDILLKILEK